LEEDLGNNNVKNFDFLKTKVLVKDINENDNQRAYV